MHYAAILMMTSPILKSAGFTKTQKSWSLMNETLFFLQPKKLINYTSSAALWQNSFVGEVTFKCLSTSPSFHYLSNVFIGQTGTFYSVKIS